MRIPPLASVAVGVQTLRANPLRTVLSTLGVIIGVAALVAILALGDGLEQFTRRQIETTTDLHLVAVRSRTTDLVDGILVPRDTFPVLTAEDAAAVAEVVGPLAAVSLSQTGAARVYASGDTTGHVAVVAATVPSTLDFFSRGMTAGRFLTATDVDSAAPVVVLSARLATRLEAGDDVLGRSVTIRGTPSRVIGIVDDGRTTQSNVYVPLTRARDLLSPLAASRPPQLVARAHRLEGVDETAAAIGGWLGRRFADSSAFSVVTSTARLAQATRAVLVFKLVMGAITGVSVLVGGIGIMNVLLASVTERTREIGIRKATGARASDIMTQFLAESVTISGVGSLIGVVTGLALAFGATAATSRLADAQVSAAFTWSTLAVAGAAAVFVGLVFGTYPARRAAGLPPIEAIRHE